MTWLCSLPCPRRLHRHRGCVETSPPEAAGPLLQVNCFLLKYSHGRGCSLYRSLEDGLPKDVWPHSSFSGAVSFSRMIQNRPAGSGSCPREGVELGLGPGFPETTASGSVGGSLEGLGVGWGSLLLSALIMTQLFLIMSC